MDLPRRRKQDTAVGEKDPLLASADENEKKHPKPSSARLPRDPVQTLWSLSLAVVAVLAFATRFWRLAEPHNVVFDEVHFGKFASYYLRRTYFFDVHPPLGKMLLALVGYLANYDGHFLFDNIGDDYIANNVPYYALRSWPAICGSLTVIYAFLSLKEIGLSIPGALFGAALLIFDNALVTQSRLILLDSMLFMFATQSVYCWIKFFKHRFSPFGFKWWLWLTLTGVSLALTMGIKMVGLFSVATIGIATLVDLWRLLDIRRGLPMRLFTKHFAARALCLICIPFLIYLVFFYVHFEILIYSGPGDAFMSPAFQGELRGSDVETKSTAIPYYANITLKHRDLKSYLHSHPDKYPLTYEDGRVSSAGQQVTGYPHKDINNHWTIIPVSPELNPIIAPYTPTEEETTRGIRYVRNQDLVQLYHPRTKSYLITHDVASSLMSTHMEMTTVLEDVMWRRYNETLWRLENLDGETGAKVMSQRTHMRVVNYIHGVAVHCHKGVLPDWGFGQHEVNGNKKKEEGGNVWFVDDVLHYRIVNGTEEGVVEEVTEKKPVVKKLSFIRKFVELQGLMIKHNAGLTSTHPYSSSPLSWPFVLRGISFWESRPNFRQVYLMGNPITWWISIIGSLMYLVMYVLDQTLLRRGLDDFGTPVRRWYSRGIGFLVVAWAVHWLPFFLMGRVLFIHHYLPSYVFSAMVAAGVAEFIGRVVTEDTVGLPPNARVSGWLRRQGGIGYWIFLGVLGTLCFASFWFFAPLSYATGFGSVEEIRRRKWLSSWDLQHA